MFVVHEAVSIPEYANMRIYTETDKVGICRGGIRMALKRTELVTKKIHLDFLFSFDMQLHRSYTTVKKSLRLTHRHLPQPFGVKRENKEWDSALSYRLKAWKVLIFQLQ